MRRRGLFAVAILAVVILTTGGSVKGCGSGTYNSSGGASNGGGPVTASGGVYALVDESGQVVYVGKTVNFVSRFRYWKRARPDLSGRILVRVDDLNIQAGAEQYLYGLAKEQAVRVGYLERMWQHSPLNMAAKGAKGEFYQRLVHDGHAYVEDFGLVGYDPRNYGRFAAVTELEGTDLGPYQPLPVGGGGDGQGHD